MRKLILAVMTVLPCLSYAQDWKLVWSDEFSKDGKIDDRYWSFEQGFVRNREPQWYQSDNAYCKNGFLVIEAKRDTVNNPYFDKDSKDWKLNRERAYYTSSSVITKDKIEFLFGRIEVRAKIPTLSGSWPAIWTKGNKMTWPHCGEVDMLEFYCKKEIPSIWANVAWGGDRQGQDVWNTQTIPFIHFTERDPKWCEKFHIWRMDWDEEYIRLYLDDELLNETPLSKTINGSYGNGTNPFHQPHFILLNLALKDTQWDNTKNAQFPITYLIDYVRVYQKTEAKGESKKK